jgi:putative protease
MSLHSDFASANRGACVQNCRRSYIVTDKESGTEFEIQNEYIMSAKDLCTISFIDKIVNAGVSVLKIEGRARGEEYVHTVTKCYHEAIDSLSDGTYSPAKIEGWTKELSTVFNRGFWDGYYLGRKMGEWNDEYGSKATKKKIYIGKGIKYFEKIGIGEFKIESQSLEVGDEIMISGPTTGIIQTAITEMRINDVKSEIAKRGETISIPINVKIRASDKLYKMKSTV